MTASRLQEQLEKEWVGKICRIRPNTTLQPQVGLPKNKVWAQPEARVYKFGANSDTQHVRWGDLPPYKVLKINTMVLVVGTRVTGFEQFTNPKGVILQSRAIFLHETRLYSVATCHLEIVTRPFSKPQS